MNDLCHEEMFRATRPGMSHADMRRVIEQVAFMHKGNHCMMHLSSWPMSNQTWPYPDFWPTDRTVEAGHMVMSEMPVGYGMYYTKIMRILREPTKNTAHVRTCRPGPEQVIREQSSEAKHVRFRAFQEGHCWADSWFPAGAITIAALVGSPTRIFLPDKRIPS